MIRKLITAKAAASMLALSPRTLYNGGAGTDKLTRIKHGRSLRFIQQEVEALIDRAVKVSEREAA